MIKSKFLKYIFGLILINFIIWNRFLRNRAASTVILSPFINIFVKLIFILFFFMLFYISLKRILKIEKESLLWKRIKNSYYIEKLSYYIKEYILNAPEYIYADITQHLDLKPYLEMPGSYFTTYCNYPKIIAIIFMEIPVIIVSSMFLFDTLFSKNFHKFFFSLYLWIILLLTRVWLFVLDSYSTRRLKHTRLFIDVTYIKESNKYKLTLKPYDELPIIEDFPKAKINAQFPVLCDFWEIYSKIYTFIQNIYFHKQQYDPYVQVYTSLCFFLGWSIQLYDILKIYS